MNIRLLLALSLSLSAASFASAQNPVPAGLDSIVEYSRNEYGQEAKVYSTVITRNADGQPESLVRYFSDGTPSVRTLFSYIDNNNDGTIDEVQDNYNWVDGKWMSDGRYVLLNFNDPMKSETQEWYWDPETEKWCISASTQINITNEGRDIEIVQYWEDWGTKAFVPVQKQVTKLRASIMPLIAANPDKPIEMLVHHMHDYVLSERYSYDPETSEWLIDDHRSQTFDENGILRETESFYYSMGELYSGDKMVYTTIENGDRYDNYTYYNGKWELNEYTTEIVEDNVKTINRYNVFFLEGGEQLYFHLVVKLNENGQAIESTSYNVVNGHVGEQYERFTYAYDERGNLTEEKSYRYREGAWVYTGINIYEYNRAGLETTTKFAYSYEGADDGWNYGNADINRYSADGKLLMRSTYYIDTEASTASDLVWILSEKICYFYHLDDAVSVPAESVAVKPSDNSAQFTWPSVDNAHRYNLYIYLHGVLFNHYVFDADGRVLGIFYAPGFDGNHNAPLFAAETGNGWEFDIQGLESGEEYTYAFTAEDEDGAQLESITGSFETKNYSGINDAVITPNAVRYNLQGKPVDESYKGIVIIGGKKVLVK